MSHVALLMEATFVAFAILMIGLTICYVVYKDEYEKDRISKQHVFIILFMTGFLGHFISEFIGTNKWFCKNGYACRR